jgi:hypothetical protein
LRSASAKEAGKTISILAQCLGDDFEQLAYKFISKDSLFKLLHNGNKVLAEVANTTIVNILNSVCLSKYISCLFMNFLIG